MPTYKHPVVGCRYHAQVEDPHEAKYFGQTEAYKEFQIHKKLTPGVHFMSLHFGAKSFWTNIYFSFTYILIYRQNVIQKLHKK
jgi:hypothetical protein